MSIIIIYLIGCFISYMRVNAIEDTEQNYYGGNKNTPAIVITSLLSWIGFIGGAIMFFTHKEPSEKFFKL